MGSQPSKSHYFGFFVDDFRFFTLGTLFGFGRCFFSFNAILYFLLKDVFDEPSSGEKKEVVKIMNHLSVSGFVHDVVAIVEQRIKAFVKKSTNVGGWGCHLSTSV
jgi:hypothetical protein